jgi:ubiquinone/menaquinone biosynthesis C-methylase UbiE
VTISADPRRLFTERRDAYDRFIRAMRYPQGLRAFFLASPLLRPGLRVLEAGCGTGALTLAIYEACAERRIPLGSFHAFDLTPAMLDRLRDRLARHGVAGVELAEADVLQPGGLPASWRGYDLVVSASMLEYVPRDRFVEALRGLRGRLADGGRFVLFMTRRNLLTRFLIGGWWRSNLYTAAELAEAFQQAGFSQVEFVRFPPAAIHLSVWGHVVQARAGR